ncbi:hypothetical protein [Microvirga guangxiensis]|uniref:Uncharacterized protein n=1 Tax=Microvirga guangxiensis TaxID=549386 RepID=A0A1G5J953_9HYPH|nr:hypothetical protein [Microvirga guangxiensis]SCY84885.1 hypothetical protein SAMN02927923_02586 [Microvirga guangxiensis]
MLRITTLVISTLTIGIWLWVLRIAIGTNFNVMASTLLMVASAPLLLFAMPALILALTRRLLGFALGLALLSVVSIILVI